MYKSIFNGTWSGVPSHLTPSDINKVLKTMHCTACAMCKRNKLPTEEGTGLHAPLPGNVLSVDYQGKINPVSVRGYTGFYLFKDSFTGMRHAELVKENCNQFPDGAAQHNLILQQSWPHSPQNKV